MICWGPLILKWQQDFQKPYRADIQVFSGPEYGRRPRLSSTLKGALSTVAVAQNCHTLTFKTEDFHGVY